MMDFREFLVLAELLAEGTTEAEWRTTVSRAYYAAFHVACECLTSLGFRVPTHTEQSHAFASRRWSNTGEWRIDDAGRFLNTLRSDRNSADYDKHATIIARHADDAVRVARSVIETLDQLLRDKPLRTHITDAIKKYERDVLKEVTWRA
jgi:uncharacterized protein (UPF0332 family)